MVRDKSMTSFDIHLFHQGSFYRSYGKFGAHLSQEKGKQGVRFTLWAPGASQVKVVGNFNGWQNGYPMEKISTSGIWSVFIPGLGEGELYKYEIHTVRGHVFLKADPYAFYAETRPRTASIVYDLWKYSWGDGKWRSRVKKASPYAKPLNIYEVHLGSWKRKFDGSFYSYRELARELVPYVKEMGYTHIELLPLMEHPLDDSWGYQITGYYAVTSRYGTPCDFMYFVDCCHQHGLGVILDWVPGHFCRDAHGLSLLDGTTLYEKGEHPHWGTLCFDFSKPEIRSFLISNALFWFDLYHVDGLRIDAVSSMLYLDYGKKAGEWEPNIYGGRENLEAVLFLQELNKTVFHYYPHALMMAEESTAWPLVTWPVHEGGLGFNFKWNMGWMNDVLRYMASSYENRPASHSLLTFSLMYAFSENFLLPLSHDEVVHGKKALLAKMPGDYWEKFANLRLLLGYMYLHPGKKLLFMGGELAQFEEWCFYRGLDWHLLDYSQHQSFHAYVKALNQFYLREKALWQKDTSWQGFTWLEPDNRDQSILVFLRRGERKKDFLVALCNFKPVVYENYRIGVPEKGVYTEVFNSDSRCFGGSDRTNEGGLRAEKIPWHGQHYSLSFTVPPLAILVFKLKK